MTPDDVRDLAIPVLAHRIMVNPESEFAGMTAEQIIDRIVEEIAPPATGPHERGSGADVRRGRRSLLVGARWLGVNLRSRGADAFLSARGWRSPRGAVWRVPGGGSHVAVASSPILGPLARLMVSRARPYLAIVSATGWALGSSRCWRSGSDSDSDGANSPSWDSRLPPPLSSRRRSSSDGQPTPSPSTSIPAAWWWRTCDGSPPVTNNGARALLASRMELPVGAGLAEFAFRG